MTAINPERASTQSDYGWTIFANDIPERLETRTHDSLRRPLASPVTFTIPARREWFGQLPASQKVQGYYRFGDSERAGGSARQSHGVPCRIPATWSRRYALEIGGNAWKGVVGDG
jgi:hypothetical protein